MTPIDREEAARQAAAELLKPEYVKESLPDRLVRAFFQWLSDLTDIRFGDGQTGSFLAALLILVVLVVITGLIIWWIVRSSRSRAAQTGLLFTERAMTADEHRRLAVKLAGEEQWAAAVQESLRAIARDLEERALVDGMPGRTADELAAEAGAALPAFADELAGAARIFDDVTYGDVPGTAAAYATLSSLDERLRQARPVMVA
ncbi:DUF4129 domain-containing protein [Nonomuraea sp. NBC_01738]|uniref:DUF4129 domain-containing protein n=1 Tax=Nonomuraea sp. NBC_01738 TaxID=2976003 RepID=UPI002E1086F6|nr:DUF4129 domain-containing protein [Nonomuraea sp. NBC_01738]